MLLFIGAGLLGGVLHIRSSMEFQLETDPSLRGRKLFSKAMQAKAPPALAPRAMLQLGLLGLAFTYQQPARESAGDLGARTTCRVPALISRVHPTTSAVDRVAAGSRWGIYRFDKPGPARIACFLCSCPGFESATHP